MEELGEIEMVIGTAYSLPCKRLKEHKQLQEKESKIGVVFVFGNSFSWLI